MSTDDPIECPPPRDRPPVARQHCRHYRYHDAPTCAVGKDLTAPGTYRCCMPNPADPCDKREEWTKEERAATVAWGDERMLRMVVIMQAIPGSGDKKKRDGWGKSGRLPCPACKTGTVSWSRARNNGHLHAACSTLWCFSIMQ